MREKYDLSRELVNHTIRVLVYSTALQKVQKTADLGQRGILQKGVGSNLSILFAKDWHKTPGRVLTGLSSYPKLCELQLSHHNTRPLGKISLCPHVLEVERVLFHAV